MNSYYESFLRKDIFSSTEHEQARADIVCELYDTDVEARRYISMLLEGYISGKYSVHQVYIWLHNNVFHKVERERR